MRQSFTFKVSQRHGRLWNSISRECNEEERHEKWFMCERASQRRLLAVSTLTQIIAPTQTSKGSSGDGLQQYDFPCFHYKKHKYTVLSFTFFCSILSFSFTRFHFLPCLLSTPHLHFPQAHSNKTAHVWFFLSLRYKRSRPLKRVCVWYFWNEKFFIFSVQFKFIFQFQCNVCKAIIVKGHLPFGPLDNKSSGNTTCSIKAADTETKL